MRLCPACRRRDLGQGHLEVEQCSSCQAIDARRALSEERIAEEPAKGGAIPGLPHLAPKIPPGKVRGATASGVSLDDLEGEVLIDLPCGARVTADEAYSHELCEKCMEAGERYDRVYNRDIVLTAEGWRRFVAELQDKEGLSPEVLERYRKAADA